MNRSRPAVAARILLPVQEFIRTEAAGGVVLLAAAVFALLWANAPVAGDSYFDFWETEISVDLGFFAASEELRDWVNELLMAVFFLVVALEIKRELLFGELAGLRRAALPVAAAIGGMIVPAALYTALNAGGEGAKGWGIPMATDIAFALGVLALLGSRVPSGLRAFLLAVAIVDDIGAIVIIALFYSGDIDPEALGAAATVTAALAAMCYGGVRNPIAYCAVGIVLWGALFESGVQPTIAGVVVGLLIPASIDKGGPQFADTTEALLGNYRDALQAGDSETVEAVLGEIEELAVETGSPLERLERLLHPWSSFLVIPIFALANAGVDLSSDVVGDAASSAVALGIMLGLLVGKPAGLFGATYIAVRLKLGELPAAVNWVHIGGLGILAGIGFTVALFITGLAFENPDLTDQAKISILASSTVAGFAGYLFLRLTSRPMEQS